MQIFKIFSLFFIMMSVSVYAQDVKEYTTEKGESLRDVAKKFDVGYRDLLKLNPKVSRWPKENTLVKLPANVLLKSTDAETKKSELTNTTNATKAKSTGVVKQQNKQIANDSVIIHVVKPKETLYSLSKLYNVEMITLINNNPVLTFDGLKIGQELKVPYQKPEIIKPSKNHIVKPKETWYGISKLYNITINELKSANTEVANNGLQIGSVLEIPGSQNQFTQNNDKPNSNTHTIKQGETLYSVSKAYGISVDELMSVNKNLVIDDIKIGTELNLPNKVVESVAVSTASPFYKQTPVFYNYYTNRDTLAVLLNKHHITLDSLKSLNPDYKNIVDKGGKLLLGFKKTHQLFGNQEWFKDSIVANKTINAMLMLPFDFKKNDTLSQEVLFANPNSLPTYVSDFYLGAKIAIDSLKKQGVKVNLDVIDTEKSVDVIYKNMSKYKALDPDVIVGPMYSNVAVYVAKQFTNVPVYYPIYSRKQSTFTNTNLIKTATEKSLFEKEIIDYIRENRKGEHLLIVGLNSDSSKLNRLKNQLSKKDALGNSIPNDVSVIAMSKGYISSNDFLDKIKLDKPNWILIANTNNVLTADIFNNVISIPKSNEENTPVKILSFQNSEYISKLSYDVLSKYHYTYATDVVEYREIENKSFEQTYLRKNHQFPSSHATRGFDVTYDAVMRVLKTKSNGTGLFNSSYRTKTAFVYKKGDLPTKTNQAIFVNSIEKTKNNELRIIRQR